MGNTQKKEGRVLACGFFYLLLTGPALRGKPIGCQYNTAYAATLHLPAKQTQNKIT